MAENNAEDQFSPNSFVDQTVANNQPPAIPSANTSATTPSVQSVQRNADAHTPVGAGSPIAPAGIRLRFSASIFDSLIFNAPISLIYILGTSLGVDSLLNGFPNIILYIILITATIGYFVYFHTQRGATPGKVIYGLKVMDFSTKNNLSINKALVREIVVRGIVFIPLIGLFFSIANFFIILFSPGKRGIHDKVANSQVLIMDKSWPLIKQLGLFLLLIGIYVVPYMLLMPKFTQVGENQVRTEEVGKQEQQVYVDSYLLPSDIYREQIRKTYKFDNLEYALVMRPSMNVLFKDFPSDTEVSFVGVLTANSIDRTWEKTWEIQDGEETQKNNPYHIWLDKGELVLAVVDQSGAGSGEGIMTLVKLSLDNPEIVGCYYFGGNYNSLETDGDYFEYTEKIDKQELKDQSSCENWVLKGYI
jgi:uncharacterized RDD family membrane protein YckC